MISGLIVTTMTDMGPYPLLNLSPISEDTTVKLSVIGMTILSMGAGAVAEKQHYRLHGSIPIPDSPNLEAVAMSFTVAPTETSDARIDLHGRESTVWLLFDSKDREQIFIRHSIIESALKRETQAIRRENDLSNPEIMRNVLDRMKKISISPEVPVRPTPEEQPYYISKTRGLEIYTIDEAGELITLETKNNLTSYSILIVCNIVIKKIFLLKLKENVSQRHMFFAGRSASNLNTKRFKNEFVVRDITDPLEIEMLLEKVGIIQKIAS